MGDPHCAWVPLIKAKIWRKRGYAPRVVLGLRGRWGAGGDSTACELPFYTGLPKALANPRLLLVCCHPYLAGYVKNKFESPCSRSHKPKRL